MKEQEAEEELSHLQARFRQCIEVGVIIPQSDTGCYACAPDDYDLFCPFFSRALQQIHNLPDDYVEPYRR